MAENPTIDQLKEYREKKLKDIDGAIAGRVVFDKVYPGMAVIMDGEYSSDRTTAAQLKNQRHIISNFKFYDLEGQGLIFCEDLEDHIHFASKFFHEVKYHYSKMLLSHK